MPNKVKESKYGSTNQHAKELSYTDWQQTIDTVSLTVGIGKKLNAEDVNVAINNQELLLKIKDGRELKVNLHSKVIGDPELQITKTKLKLTFKKIECDHWTNLESDSVRIQSDDESQTIVSSNLVSTAAAVSASIKVLTGCDANFSSSFIDTGAVSPGNASLSASSMTIDMQDHINSPVSSNGTLKTFSLPHIKHDFFEKGRRFESVTICIYVKSVKQETVHIDIGDDILTLQFKTVDKQFLDIHSGSDENTLFNWTIHTVDELEPSGYEVKISQTKIELTVAKKSPRKWNGLERPPNQDLKKRTNTVFGPSNSDGQSNKSFITMSKTTNLPTSSAVSATSVTQTTSTTTSAIKDGGGDGGSVTNHKVSSTVPKKPLGKFEIRHASGPSSIATQESVKNDQPFLSQSNSSNVSYMGNGILWSQQKAIEPGSVGLINLGNTCFMNSVLQVLASTVELRDYFVEGKFAPELNYTNPLGFKGKLALAFSELMKQIWSGKHSWISPSDIKAIVASKAPQFHGFLQHDAQEFMEFLLDGLHEDLNRIRNKPYTEMIDSDGRPDEVIAAESWRLHKQRNDSIIVDLFHGQFKSRLVCPDCQKVSITFDPFMVLPVPLPTNQKCVQVVFFYYEPSKRPIKMNITLSNSATVSSLKEQVAKRLRLTHLNMKVLRISNGAVQSVLNATEVVPETKREPLLVCEVLVAATVGEPVLEMTVIQRSMCPLTLPIVCNTCNQQAAIGTTLKRCTNCYSVAYCNSECQKNDWRKHQSHCHLTPEIIGQPFVVCLPLSQAKFSNIANQIEAFARYSVDILSSNTSNASSSQSPINASDNCKANGNHISSNRKSGGTPLFRSLSCESDSAFMDVSITDGLNYSKSLSSSEDTSNSLFSNSQVELNRSLNSVNGNHLNNVNAESSRQRPFNIRPANCLGQPKQGSGGNKLIDLDDQPLSLISGYYVIDWRNHVNCAGSVNVKSKSLDCDAMDDSRSPFSSGNYDVTLNQCLRLFTEPEVLTKEHAWYCPKCKNHKQANKQLLVWSLPPVLIIQIKRFSFRNIIMRDKLDKFVSFPITGLDLSEFCMNEHSAGKTIYDLYAVVNHHGNGLNSGHYTTYARCANHRSWNTNDIGWRYLDDSHVYHVKESEIVTRDAYVLFYRRRDISLTAKVPVSLNTFSQSTVKVNGSVYSDNLMDSSTDSSDEDKINGNVSNAQSNRSAAILKSAAAQKSSDANILNSLSHSTNVQPSYSDMDVID